MATASTNAWLTHHGELEATCHHDPKEEGQWLSSPPPTRARIRAAKNAELAPHFGRNLSLITGEGRVQLADHEQVINLLRRGLQGHGLAERL